MVRVNCKSLIFLICFVTDVLSQVEISLVEHKPDVTDNLIENIIVNDIFNTIAKTMDDPKATNTIQSHSVVNMNQMNNKTPEKELDEIFDKVFLFGNNKQPGPKIFQDESPMIFFKKNLKQNPLDAIESPLKIFSDIDQVMNELLKDGIQEDKYRKQEHHHKHKGNSHEHNKHKSHHSHHHKRQDNIIEEGNSTETNHKDVEEAHTEPSKNHREGSGYNVYHDKNHKASLKSEGGTGSSYFSLVIYILILLIFFFVIKNFLYSNSKDSSSRSINSTEEEFRGLKSY